MCRKRSGRKSLLARWDAQHGSLYFRGQITVCESRHCFIAFSLPPRWVSNLRTPLKVKACSTSTCHIEAAPLWKEVILAYSHVGLDSLKLLLKATNSTFLPQQTKSHAWRFASGIHLQSSSGRYSTGGEGGLRFGYFTTDNHPATFSMVKKFDRNNTGQWF